MQRPQEILKSILTAAADESGKLFMPLKSTQRDSVQKMMAENAGNLDEAFLITAQGWLQKASQVSEPEMEALLQEVLQMYAAEALTSQYASGDGERLNAFLRATPAEWDALSAKLANEFTEEDLKSDLQRKRQDMTQNTPSGSYAQRIQSEYLKEASKQIADAFAQKKEQDSDKYSNRDSRENFGRRKAPWQEESTTPTPEADGAKQISAADFADFTEKVDQPTEDRRNCAQRRAKRR